MLCKGKISAVMSGGGFATVTPYNGGTVTPELVVPQSLAGVLTAGDPVVYALFPDNTGIIFQRADGIGNSTGGGAAEPSVGGEILLRDQSSGETYSVYTENGELKMEPATGDGVSEYSLVDRVTGVNYNLYVTDGKLTMERCGGNT